MQIGRIKSEEEAEKFVGDKLLEVKEILDDIADQTGLVYLVLNSEIAEVFGVMGTRMLSAMNSVLKIIPDRIEMANRAQEIGWAANKKLAEKMAKEAQKNDGQGDLFADASKKVDNQGE